MTNEKAIEAIKFGHCDDIYYRKEYEEAVNMAIKALEQEPCIQEKQANADKIDAVYIDGFKAGYSQARFDLEQEPCEDAISRQAMLDALSTWDKFGCDADTKLVPYKDHYIPYIHYDDVVKCIKGLPSVSTEKTGRWISHYDEDAKEGWYECDRCHTERAFNTKYCPDCGAKMREVGDTD